MKQTILITGGTGKLGQQFLKHFSDKGWRVLFTSRDPEKIKLIESSFSTHDVRGIELDLEAEDLPKQIAQQLRSLRASPTVLVNNARNLSYGRSREEANLLPRKKWLGEFTTNVIAAYELSLSLADDPRSRLQSIVNISSIYGLVAQNPHLYDDSEKETSINYGVCKAALNHLSKELSVRLAPRRITVNTVSYGGVEGRATPEFQKRYAEHTPLRRMLNVKEVSGVVEFLTSSEARMITGQNIVMDGGWTTW